MNICMFQNIGKMFGWMCVYWGQCIVWLKKGMISLAVINFWWIIIDFF